MSDFKLATSDVLKRIGTARRRSASSCNALAVDTFSSSFFFYQTPILKHRAATAHQMYTTGSVVEYTRYSHSAFSPIPPLIFTGGQKVLNLASFSTSLSFSCRYFKTKQRIAAKVSGWMRPWCSSILSKFGGVRSNPLWGVVFGNTPLGNK